MSGLFQMKKNAKVIASLFCMCIMVSMVFIEADNNSLIITADLRVVNNKFEADVGEIIEFDAFYTSGPWQTLVYFFHDGSEPLQTTDTTVPHAFPMEGKYLVTLMVVGMAGISDTDTVEITIINSQPSASIEMANQDGDPTTSAQEDENIALHVVDPTDTPNDLGILQYRWLLGDGNVVTGSEIQYAWRYAGTYTITLQVLDDQLAMNYETTEIMITNTPPIAEFEVVSDQGLETYHAVEDETLVFNASATQDTTSDYQKLQYYWDFDDGTVGRGREIHHTYYESGLYIIKLLVMDDDGASSTLEKTITINNLAPTIDITTTDVLLEEGQTFTFLAESHDTPTDYQRLEYFWGFGQTGWQTSHPWTDDWAGIISAEVEDPEGQTDIDQVNVTVLNVPPQASISMAFITGNLTLKAAGTPNNTIEFRLYGNEQVVTNFTLDRIPGDPKSQAITIPFLFDLSKTWRIEVAYKDAIEGANPSWLTFTLPDGNAYQAYHNFVVNHEATWVWEVLPHDYFFSWPITFNGTIFDPSSDGINGEVKFNSISILNISHVEDGSWPVELPFEVTLYLSHGSLLAVTAEDDDGASAYAQVEIYDGGQMAISYLAPRIEIGAPLQVTEDMLVDFTPVYYGPYPLESLTFTWNFGDGNVVVGANVNHTYSSSGDYLVQLTVEDPQGETTTRGVVIEVENFVPIVEVMGIFESTEDYELDFEPQVYESASDQDDLRYFWVLGDGAVAAGTGVSHRYARSGSYSLQLRVVDDNGAVGMQSVPVTIYDESPVVDGPYGFEVVEGGTIIAEIVVYDSTVDEPNLQYCWAYDSEITYSRIFTTREDDGFYNVSLTIEDPGTIAVQDNISLAFISEPPVVVASNFILYGAPSSLDLKAYALDSYTDIPDLTYTWYIDDVLIPDGTGVASTINYNFLESRTYHGHVIVEDDSGYAVSSEFTTMVILDSDGDGLTDEVEVEYGTNGSSADSDGDFLTDTYELDESHTNPNAWDSDGDLLADGLDANTSVMTGELILGTDPWNPDTDGDNLTDGLEVLGWDILVHEWVDGFDPQGNKTRHVFANPLKIDTDGDGLTDWEEWDLRYDPERPDTDGDGETDFEEEGRAAAFDTDNDGLSDSLENTPITEYVPLKYVSHLTTDSSWENAMDIQGEITNTEVAGKDSWIGQSRVQSTPQLVTFIGEVDSITTEYNKLVIYVNLSAGGVDAHFQLWNGNDWVTYRTFQENTSDYIVITTDSVNTSQWVHGGILKFRLEGGYILDETDTGIYYNSFIELFFVEVTGVIKYFLASESVWSDAYEIQGDIINTQINDGSSWFGRSKVPLSPLTVNFEGVINSITTIDNKITIFFRVSADDFPAQLYLYDGNDWVLYQTFEESLAKSIILITDESNASQWIHSGTLRFSIKSGYTEEPWWLIPKYNSYIELFYFQIEEFTEVTTTISDSELPDTDGDGLFDWEEYYPGKDGFITHLRNNDTDNDALLDSSEVFSITKEYGKRERVLITRLFDEWKKAEFYFTAIIGGRVQNSTVTVGFSSQTDLKINLVQVQVAGVAIIEDMNPEIEEPIDINGIIFYKNYNISKEITTYSGEWRLIIDIEPLDPDSIEEFSILLEDFKVDVMQGLDPLNPDCDKDGLFDGYELNPAFSGWVTNPKVWDSDGDFWSDFDEIRNYNTNPLSTDTDGDGVDDPYDQDPLFNLMLKINIYKGHFENAYFTRRLAVVVKIEDQAIATPAIWASEDPIQRGWWIFKWTADRTANFEAAGFTEYYFDTPDQRSSLQIGLELWKVTILWDTKLLDMSYSYALGTGLDTNPSGSETLVDEEGDWVRFDVQTIGMKRVNTIAIKTEGNFFEGHYSEIERFIVVVLGIDEPDDLFTNGVNVIVIPVSLFIHTKLHAMWENEDIPIELNDASDSGFNASFYGLSGNAENINQYVEGMIVKGLDEGDYVTILEAWAILEYLVNNATDHPLYSYYICDEAGEVESLGLAREILDLIPFDAQMMENDDTGPMPKGFWDWLISIFITILLIIALAVLAPFIFLGILIISLIYIGIVLIGPLIAAAVLAVLKLIILIYVFIMLALTLLSLILAFFTFLIFLFILTASQPELMSFGFLWFELNEPTASGRFEIVIEFEYSSILDLTIPCLKINTYQDGELMVGIILSFGIPVDVGNLILPPKPEESLLSSENIEAQVATLESNSVDEADGESFNLGRWFALIPALIFLPLLYVFSNNPLAGLILIVLSPVVIFLFLILMIFLNPSDNIESLKAETTGYAIGLFLLGKSIAAPMWIKGGFKQDAPKSIGMGFLIGWLILPSIFPEYLSLGPPLDPDGILIALAYTGFAALSAYLYNSKGTDNQIMAKNTWNSVGLVFMFLGLALMVLIRLSFFLDWLLAVHHGFEISFL